MEHKLQINPAENNLVFGDCKYWLPFIPDNSIDLIYIDPPFFSNTTYEVIWGNGFERRCFEDRFKGITHYSNWMRERIFMVKDKLKKTGSIFVHCDYRANYKLREVLNEVFGEKNFVNEIIWDYKTGGVSEKWFSRKHDTILFYQKDKIRKFYPLKEKTYIPTLKNRTFAKEKLNAFFDKKGCSECGQKGGYAKMSYMKDVWRIKALFRNNKERIGYKTQKPEALIKRIIECCTKESDTVLDFFGGGGTTAKVAHDLDRKFITGDVSPVSFRVMIDRLKEAGASFNKINPPLTRTEWLSINDKEFEKKICMFQGWTHNPTSKPVDGWVDKTKRIPVEIKNHSGQTGVGDIRKLAGAMAMAGQKEGVFVAWHFSKGCFEYVAQLEKKEKKKIDLVFAHTIIGELVLTKSQREEYQALYGERVKASKQRVRVLGKAG